MLIGLQQVDWNEIGKTWGPLGVGFVLFVVLVWQGAKLGKKFLEDTVADARRERDLSREMLKQQALEFTAHIKTENEEFRRSLKEVVDTLDRTRTRK
jgi:hypothetical protein